MDPTIPKPAANTVPTTSQPWIDNAPPAPDNSEKTVVTPSAPTPVGPPPPPFPTTPPPSNSVMGNPMAANKKPKGFIIFVTVGILLLIGIWGYVGYLYFQNSSTPSRANVPTVTQAPSPTPELDPSEIQIVNGDVVRVTSFGETQTLVKKDQYQGTGITGFARVNVSPDKTKMCFESIPPAIDPALYIAKIDGSSVEEVAKNHTNCTWVDKNYIVSLNAPVGTQKKDLYSYSVTDKKLVNLTETLHTNTQFRQYSLGELSGNSLSCKYDIVNASGKKLSSNNCTVDTSNWTITDTGI